MRYLYLTIGLLLLPLTAWPTPADSLAQAHKELADGHPYAADASLHEVVTDDDATVIELEEALFLATMIYSGDVLGAVALMQPLTLATNEGSKWKAEISQQLLLARRAFVIAANNYLDVTVVDQQLASLKCVLPALSNDDVEVMMGTLSDAETLSRINSTYGDDPAPGRGLQAQVNRYSMLLALGDATPMTQTRDLATIRSRFAAGQSFSQLHYIDWMARVALDMHALLSEPNGPDLLGLSQRCDQRILQLAGDDENNTYVQRAREREASANR
jgi:hypothetical protein